MYDAETYDAHPTLRECNAYILFFLSHNNCLEKYHQYAQEQQKTCIAAMSTYQCKWLRPCVIFYTRNQQNKVLRAQKQLCQLTNIEICKILQ